jgi:hypothetical protein
MKWSIWRATLYGLAIGLAVFAVNTMADGGQDMAAWWSYSHPAEFVGYLTGRLLVLPILFVVVAFIHNRFAKAGANEGG